MGTWGPTGKWGPSHKAGGLLCPFSYFTVLDSELIILGVFKPI